MNIEEVLSTTHRISPRERVPFHCTCCGECCRHVRQSVPLESPDVFRLTRLLRERDKGVICMDDCALPGFVDSKNEEKTERNAVYLVVSHSGGGMLRQGTRKGIRRTPANRGMRAHWVVKGLDISEDVCHGLCP